MTKSVSVNLNKLWDGMNTEVLYSPVVSVFPVAPGHPLSAQVTGNRDLRVGRVLANGTLVGSVRQELERIRPKSEKK